MKPIQSPSTVVVVHYNRVFLTEFTSKRAEHEVSLFWVSLTELTDKMTFLAAGITVSGCGSSCGFQNATNRLNPMDISWLMASFLILREIGSGGALSSPVSDRGD